MIRLESVASSHYTTGAKRPASESDAGRKKRKTKRKERARNEDDNSSSDIEEIEEPQSAPRRSGRSKKLPAHDYGAQDDDEDSEDEDAMDESPDFSPAPRAAVTPVIKQEQESGTLHTTTFTLEEEDDESKDKPDLRLTYQGFTIFGNCLCVSCVSL